VLFIPNSYASCSKNARIFTANYINKNVTTPLYSKAWKRTCIFSAEAIDDLYKTLPPIVDRISEAVKSKDSSNLRMGIKKYIFTAYSARVKNEEDCVKSEAQNILIPWVFLSAPFMGMVLRPINSPIVCQLIRGKPNDEDCDTMFRTSLDDRIDNFMKSSGAENGTICDVFYSIVNKQISK